MKKSKKSFSLVEVSIVVAIIGVLVSICFPAVNAVINASKRSKAANYLRQIALLVCQYMQDMNHPLRFQDLDEIKGNYNYSAGMVAGFLEKYGYLYSPEIWSWNFDPCVSNYGDLPSMVLNSDGKLSEDYGQCRVPMSVCVICAGNSTTNDDFLRLGNFIPVAYSRGLRESDTNAGEWAELSTNTELGGVWGKSGGLIAFFDGHVEWVENRAQFRKYSSTEQTHKLHEALPNGATSGEVKNSSALSWKGYGENCGVF